ncbi:glycine-rich domain-containing protein [Fulvivirga sediminis]|uniref:TIGR04222 domain-containing membrane protein n=1 Tax=Fulvivirga sediminis TaxID=2803949 RepID=A0A937K0B5_9BACT|nr:hypothetical protein [Fulvivirga sediminis]MBL3656141.1 hypothetical protein [Fulvivirga sediminis]
MDKTLWNKILSFDLDAPLSEYGFSTRLAKENAWTQNFTRLAILEYKKFMYLAGTAGAMVSPSEIVDLVWHQHLIFSDSYEQFCEVIGSNIKHIPSTHNKKEKEKFLSARNQTFKLYKETFGEPPAVIWKYPDMYAPMGLKEASMRPNTRLYIMVLFIVAMMIPTAAALRPVYLSINNPLFLMVFVGAGVFLIIILHMFNQHRVRAILERGETNFFIRNLTAAELIFVNSGRLEKVIDSYVNKLMRREVIEVVDGDRLRVKKSNKSVDAQEFAALQIIENEETTSYYRLSTLLYSKPSIVNIPYVLMKFRNFFNQSKDYGRLVTINCVAITMLMLFGIGRLINGMGDGKPVLFLVLLLLAFIILCFNVFNKMQQLVLKQVPSLYDKEEVLRQHPGDPEWEYCFLGAAVISSALVPLVEQTDYLNPRSTSWFSGGRSREESSCGSDIGSSCGSNCGSGCGSSCSSGCGGGGGCGGCGGS